MGALHDASDAVETYTPAEERFNRRRRTVGLFAAPAVLIALLVAPIPTASTAGHHLAAILATVIVLWVTEAIPISATALLGPTLAVMFGVAPARAAFAPFADPVIFLFIGSLFLAQGMFVHGVDRRIAFTVLASRRVGAGAGRILIAYASVAVLVSMWVSNTATTAMMFPIGLAVASHLMRLNVGTRSVAQRFALGMMLMTAYGASIGGLGTPVGTPPNLIGVSMLDRLAGVRIGFFQFMALGVPVLIVLHALTCTFFYFRCARGLRIAPSGVEVIQAELRSLGPMSRAQWNVLAAFLVTVTLWLTPGVFAIFGVDQAPFARRFAAAVPESAAALIGGLLLFVAPVDWRARRFTLTWEEAVRIDWGIILLYGGGLSLGEMAFSTGLAESVGKGLTAWLPNPTPFALTAMFTATAILVSEATSNTASANMVIPVAIAVAQAAGVRPIEPALGATLGASMGFMMPISTPPNAIVYSSGFIPITAMMRYGIALDLTAFLVIVLAVTTLGPVIF